MCGGLTFASWVMVCRPYLLTNQLCGERNDKASVSKKRRDELAPFLVISLDVVPIRTLRRQYQQDQLLAETFPL